MNRFQNRFGGPSCSLGNGGILALNGQNPLAVVFHLPLDEVQLVVTLDVVVESESRYLFNTLGSDLSSISWHTLACMSHIKKGVHPKASLVLRASEAEDELKD